jgi:succinyl-CoA synthetase beta subunit
MGNQNYCSYPEIESLFTQYGIALPPAAFIPDPEKALAAFQSLIPPIALKVVSQAESHKSDKGLVRLGINTKEEFLQAMEDLSYKSKGFSVEGFLIQEMAPEGIEIITGLVNDPTFGMMLVFGAGGILVELLDTVTLRIAPIGLNEAKWIIEQHPVHRLLDGYRGKPSMDCGSLADLLVKLSILGAENSAMIESLDINPVIVSQEGVHVVDIRIKKKDATHV